MKFEAEITVPERLVACSATVTSSPRRSRRPATGASTGRWTSRTRATCSRSSRASSRRSRTTPTASRSRTWIPKGREADGKRTFERTPDMVKHFGRRLGVKYPWNKYAQVVVSDFIFGGMENTTATTHVRAHPARRARGHRHHQRRPHRPRARAPVVRRLRHVPRLVRGLAERGLRDLHGARLARGAPRPRRVRVRPARPISTATRARPTGATGAPSCARTTTRRSICSIATSTRRAVSSSTCSAPSSATSSSGRA